MAAGVGIETGHIEHRERPRDRRGVAVTAARRERPRDFEGVALGLGVGAMLWLVLASVVRLIG